MRLLAVAGGRRAGAVAGGIPRLIITMRLRRSLALTNDLSAHATQDSTDQGAKGCAPPGVASVDDGPRAGA
jgi:hypothetical protein